MSLAMRSFRLFEVRIEGEKICLRSSHVSQAAHTHIIRQHHAVISASLPAAPTTTQDALLKRKRWKTRNPLSEKSIKMYCTRNLCNITSTNDFYIFFKGIFLSCSFLLFTFFIFIILILFVRRSFVRFHSVRIRVASRALVAFALLYAKYLYYFLSTRRLISLRRCLVSLTIGWRTCWAWMWSFSVPFDMCINFTSHRSSACLLFGKCHNL